MPPSSPPHDKRPPLTKRYSTDSHQTSRGRAVSPLSNGGSTTTNASRESSQPRTSSPGPNRPVIPRKSSYSQRPLSRGPASPTLAENQNSQPVQHAQHAQAAHNSPQVPNQPQQPQQQSNQSSNQQSKQDYASSAAAAASKRPVLKVFPPHSPYEPPVGPKSHAHTLSNSSSSSRGSFDGNAASAAPEIVQRRLWFRKKSGGSATSLIVTSAELVDDVKIRILEKYPTSLQQRCDPADLVMTVSQPSGIRLELQPDENIIEVMDRFFPAGMEMNDALEVGPSASMWCSPMQHHYHSNNAASLSNLNGNNNNSNSSSVSNANINNSQQRGVPPRTTLQRARSYSNTQQQNFGNQYATHGPGMTPPFPSSSSFTTPSNAGSGNTTPTAVTPGTFGHHHFMSHHSPQNQLNQIKSSTPIQEQRSLSSPTTETLPHIHQHIPHQSHPQPSPNAYPSNQQNNSGGNASGPISPTGSSTLSLASASTTSLSSIPGSNPQNGPGSGTGTPVGGVGSAISTNNNTTAQPSPQGEVAPHRQRQKRSTGSSVLLLPRKLPLGKLQGKASPTVEKPPHAETKLIPFTGGTAKSTGAPAGGGASANTTTRTSTTSGTTAGAGVTGVGAGAGAGAGGSAKPKKERNKGSLDSQDATNFADSFRDNFDTARRDSLLIPPNRNNSVAHGSVAHNFNTLADFLQLQQQLSPALTMSQGKPTVVPQIKILIVEDNPVNQKILEAFMKRKKVRYDVAKNGREALEKWKVGGFHLILMDIQLPVMTGLEATKEIRRLEVINGIGAFPQAYKNSTESAKPAPHEVIKKSAGGFRSPVIIVALTASSDSDDKSDALAAGCNDFLTKPVNFMWLEKKIIEWGCMQALIDFDGWKKWSDDGRDVSPKTSGLSRHASLTSLHQHKSEHSPALPLTT